MSTAIRTRGLVCGHHGIPYVHDLDLHVDEGEIVVLVGPNGAGKTTVLSTLAGALPSLGGNAQVLGFPVLGQPAHQIARRGLVFVPEDRGLFGQLTVAQNLRLRNRSRNQAVVDETLDRFPSLALILKRRAGLLSGGEQQLLALAGAIVSQPKVLLIDEMSLGLAPKIVAQLLELLRTLANTDGIAVLLVEQHVHACLAIADRGYVLNQGQLVAEGSSEELLQKLDQLHNAYLGGPSEQRAG
jgi:branched-chain amino acid transport system ATP-binding protein